MRSYSCLVLLSVLVCLNSSSSAQTSNPSATPPTTAKAQTSIAHLPLTFEPNIGQGMEGRDYLARSGATRIGLSADRMELTLPYRRNDHRLNVLLVNGNRQAQIVASERGPGESNYLLGNQASTWLTHIPQYNRLTYGGVYPGIDLTFYGDGEKVEHDFVIKPGGAYKQIKMRYEGADQLFISSNGDLHVRVGDSEVLVRIPRIYQTAEDGHQIKRSGQFVLLSENEVGFRVKAFDPSMTLVIDPVLNYATYLADQSLSVDAMTIDAAGNTYIVGQTFSASYPVSANAVQGTCASCASNQPDIFITKLNATGTAQIFSTFLGGSNYDQPSKVAVDGNGNVIVGGVTQSTDFPVKNSINMGVGPFENGFVASLAPDGASLNFSSLLIGGSGSTLVGGLTADTSGNVYVAGTTVAPSFPVTPGALHAGTPDDNDNYVYLMKLQSSGGLIYSALLGATGSASDCCSVAGIAVDSNSNVYVAGSVGVITFTTNTPWPITAGAYQSAMTNDIAPFVAKVSPDASNLLYSTLVGNGLTTGMALTPDNQVILFGQGTIPVTPDAYSSIAGTSFIEKLSADATQLTYGTYFSTPTADTGGTITNIGLDPLGNVWIAGNTQFNANIPLVDPLQSVPGATEPPFGSAFVSEFDPLMHTLLFSTYFNGTLGGSRINGIALDTQGRAHIAGTGMDDLPTTSPAYLHSVTPPPANFIYTYGFAALIDPTVPGPGICFSNSPRTTAQVGSSSQATLNVTNCGNGPLNISNVQIASPVFSLALPSGCIGEIAAGATCAITANFTPTVAGTFSAPIVITSNAMVPVYTLSVSGIATAPSISVDSPLVFDPQVLGISGSGVSYPVFATNSGTAPLIVDPSQATIAGNFSILSNNCGTPISPGFACAFTVAFNPTALGISTGTLTISSNDPVNPSVTVQLSGSAIAAYTTPTITSLSLPSIVQGSPATGLYVYGTNFFPTSYVTIDGEPHSTDFLGSTALYVTIDPALLTAIGDLPITVVSPSPGGQSTSTQLNVFQTLPISAAALVYNPATSMLYASSAANATTNPNTILPIDPLTGKVGTPIPVGKDPAKLALSGDGTYLYVAAQGDHTIQRINLTTSQVERTFPLPVDALTNTAATVDDMHVVPGSPQSVVVSLFRPASPGEAGAAIYTDSGLSSFLGNTFQNNNLAIDSFTFTSDPTTLFAYPFSNTFFTTMGVTPSTLTLPTTATTGCCNQSTGSIAASDGSLLYTNSGQVWNPATSSLLGTYPGPPGSPNGSLLYELSVVPDMTVGRTYFLDTLHGFNDFVGYTDILSYNQATFSPTGILSLKLSNYSFSVDLLRWGADGFAFRTRYQGEPSDAIVIVRSNLADTATGGTPSLSALLPASTSAGGSTFQLTVNGSGFIPGSTVLWNGSPRQTTFASSTQLISLIPSSDIATAAVVQITVTNPAPGSTSSPFTFNVVPSGSLTSQTINFPTPSPITFGTAPVTLSATASSNLPVTLSVTGPATLSGNTLTPTGAGSVTITAIQPGNISYSAAPTVQQTILIAQAAPTITWDVPAAIALGTALSSVQLNAVVTGVNGAPLAGTLTYSPASGTILPAGSQTLRATFTPSDTADYTSQSNSVTLLVNKITPTLTLTSSLNPALVQSAVTLSVTVSSSTGAPTGTVSFLDGATVLGSGTLTGGMAAFTTSSLASGSHSITAIYSGDGSFTSLTSTPLIENVQDFNVNISNSPGVSTSQTVSPGGTANFALSLAPTGSTFLAPVILTVGGLPPGASSTLTPTTIPTGAGATNVNLTVLVPANSASVERSHLALASIGLGILLLPFSFRLRRSGKLGRILVIAILVVAGAGATAPLSGCGGKDNTPTPTPTPTPKNYSITVTGTSGALTRSTSLTLTVN